MVNASDASFFLGKTIEDWCDIYCLQIFHGKEVKSLKDLISWQQPSSPKESLIVAFDFVEAQKINSLPARELIRNFLESRASYELL